MMSCQQSQHQTILQHGFAVATKFKELITGQTEGWQLPPWFADNRDFLLSRLPNLELLETYHIYHDCGKPYCRRVDEDGKQHFPNHAQVSAGIWRTLGGDEQIARLIQHDMDMHLLRPETARTYEHLDLAPALLLTALSELHANAAMFGGIDSTSFKIKSKCLTKCGAILLSRLKEQS